MAIIKPIVSGASLGIALKYVMKTEKTEEKLLSGLFCDPKTAIDDMNLTKEVYDKTDGRQYKHFVQSFAPNEENITTELAHEIALKFAEKCFPGFEIVVATHKDTSHIHSHFIVNSVNFENGLKIQNSAKDLQNMRDYSDELCRENGLSVIEKNNNPKSYKKKTQLAIERAKADENNNNIPDEQKYKCYKLDCFRAVQESANESFSVGDFIKKMSESGYSTSWANNRKHITFEDKNNNKIRAANLEKTFDVPLSKLDLEKRFMMNSDMLIQPIQKENKPVIKTLSYDEIKNIKNRIVELEKWIEAYKNYKKYKPFDDRLQELYNIEKTIFNRKKIDNQINSYERNHVFELTHFIGATNTLPDKPTDKKRDNWKSELDSLREALVTNTPPLIIAEIKSKQDRNKQRTAEHKQERKSTIKKAKQEEL